MLINLTNHPSDKWTPQQITKAMQQYGTIVDIPFPIINPADDEQQISALADHYLHQVLAFSDKEPITVHIMGEMTFTYALINRLHKHGIPCIASTTQRIVKEFSNGERITQFNFVRFRHYE